jgi:hypothetical protein
LHHLGLLKSHHIEFDQRGERRKDPKGLLLGKLLFHHLRRELNHSIWRRELRKEKRRGEGEKEKKKARDALLLGFIKIIL